MKQLVKNLSLYLFISYLNLFAAINIINPYQHNHVIYDIGFEYLPKIDHSIPHIPFTILYIYFCIRWFISNPNILENFFEILYNIFTIRLLSFTTTILPSSLPGCFSRESGEDILWFTDKVESACSDNMFSGHAVHFVLITLFTLHYSNNILEKNIMKIMFFPYLLLIIASRLHYTSDVVIGSAITILTFHTKHNYIT